VCSSNRRTLSRRPDAGIKAGRTAAVVIGRIQWLRDIAGSGKMLMATVDLNEAKVTA